MMRRLGKECHLRGTAWAVLTARQGWESKPGKPKRSRAVGKMPSDPTPSRSSLLPGQPGLSCQTLEASRVKCQPTFCLIFISSSIYSPSLLYLQKLRQRCNKQNISQSWHMEAAFCTLPLGKKLFLPGRKNLLGSPVLFNFLGEYVSYWELFSHLNATKR